MQMQAGARLDLADLACAVNRGDRVGEQQSHAAFLSVTPEIIRDMAGFDMGKHVVPFFNNSDVETEIDQRHGDFHAEKACAQHDRTLGTSGDLASDRLAFDLSAQVVDAGKFGTWKRKSLAASAGRNQQSLIAVLLARGGGDDLSDAIERDRLLAEH